MAVHRNHIACRALLVFTALALPACAASGVRSDTDFWSMAEPEPKWDFEPPRDLPTSATLVFDEFDAIVSAQSAGRVSGADFSLLLKSIDGTARLLHYRLGGGRSLPLKSGDHVHLMEWRRWGPLLPTGKRDMDGRGMVVTAMWGGPEEAPTPVAVINVRSTVPANAMPEVLHRIVASDAQAWQTAERTTTDCYLAESHHPFIVGEAPRGRRVKPPMAPPGGRVRLWDGEATYEVVLLDNRRVLQTDCVPEPLPWWGWAALWTPEKGRALGRTGEGARTPPTPAPRKGESAPATERP